MVENIVVIITFLLVSIAYVVIVKVTLKSVFVASKDHKGDLYKIKKHTYMNNIRIMKVVLYLLSGLLTYYSIVQDGTIPLAIILILISTLEGVDNLIQFLLDKKYGC